MPDSDANLRSFIDAVPEGVLVAGADGVIVIANSIVERQFGYGSGELIGVSVDALVPDDQRAAHATVRSDFSSSHRNRTRGARDDVQGRRRDGSTFAAQVGLSTWRTSEGTSTIVVVVDVSELRQADRDARAQEQAALEAGELNRAIIRDAPLGIIMYDAESGACVAANATAARITGLTEAALREQKFREIASWKSAGMLGAAETALVSGAAVTRDTQLMTGAGRHVVLDCEFRVIRLRDRPHLVVMMNDLTERRNLEAQLRVAQKMEAIGQLAGGVAHDFNNLLTVIGTYTTLMIEDCKDNDPKKEDLLEIMGAATRAATLTRQLLAFGRRQLLDSRVLDLNEVVAGLEKMLRRVISAEIDLQIVRGEGIGAVHADAGQLEQVILNLVVNARDAMPSGGKLTIATARVAGDTVPGNRTPAGSPAIGPGGPPSGPMVMLSVSDTGIGMDERTVARIFEPFFTTKEAGRGSGLGLSTTYGIARQSGGQVRVRSQPGEGTTFEVLLPVVVAHAEVPEYLEYADGDMQGSGLVLVAEDDDSVRRIVVSTLKKFGYDVVAASNGEQALALPFDDATAPVLLLTDVVMPSMSGRTLAEKLRERWPDLPVLFTSAYATDGTTGEVASDLPGALLRKPFVPGELAAAVRHAITNRSTHVRNSGG